MNDPQPGAPAAFSLEERVAQLERQLGLVEKYAVAGFWTALDGAYRSSTDQRTIECIVCGNTGAASSFKDHISQCQFGGGELRRHGCPKCGCIFGPLKYLDLNEDFVSADYQLLYSRYSEADSTDNEILAFHSLSPTPGALYLDWGSGGQWSKTIESLRASGFEVWGYEPSAPATSGFVVNTTDQISAKFDGIFSNNVIEHFRDPVSQFKYFAGILKSGGRMAHQTACYAYEYANTRFHTLFLLGDSPHVLAERTGFRAERVPAAHDSINYVYTKLT
jgi:hypothetical protein